jgi:hypothetical protein
MRAIAAGNLDVTLRLIFVLDMHDSQEHPVISSKRLAKIHGSLLERYNSFFASLSNQKTAPDGRS